MFPLIGLAGGRRARRADRRTLRAGVDRRVRRLHRRRDRARRSGRRRKVTAAAHGGRAVRSRRRRRSTVASRRWSGGSPTSKRRWRVRASARGPRRRRARAQPPRRATRPTPSPPRGLVAAAGNRSRRRARAARRRNARPRRRGHAVSAPAYMTPAGAAVPAYMGGASAADGRDAGVAAPPTSRPAAAKPNPIWAWITGGNTLARVGVVLLFIGVGFLLKYAAEHVHVPIELRLAGVALGGVALLVRRLAAARAPHGLRDDPAGRRRRRAVPHGVRRAALYALVPAAGGVRRCWSRSRRCRRGSRCGRTRIALAALGVVGGFLAPILTSSDSGNHVLLFSYYALLNAGIFGIAWFKAWRLAEPAGLRVHVRRRHALGRHALPARALRDDRAVPRAVLPVLRRDRGALRAAPLGRGARLRRRHARVRHAARRRRAAERARARHRVRDGVSARSRCRRSTSCSARFLYARARDDLRLLVEAFLALGVVFATLAVPLALDARWTSATWALEGAAIVWVGVRQRPRAGARVRPAAAVRRRHRVRARAVAVVQRIGPPAALPIAQQRIRRRGAGRARRPLHARGVYQRGGEAVTPIERALIPAIFAWGVLWWLFAGWREIDRFVAPPTRSSRRWSRSLAVTALAFAFASRAPAWPMARVPALLLLPALLVARRGRRRRAIGFATSGICSAHGGFVAWPFAIVVDALLLRRFEREGAYAADGWVFRGAHAVLLWLVAAPRRARARVARRALCRRATASGATCRGAWCRRSRSRASCSLARPRGWPVARIRAAISSSARFRWSLWMLAVGVRRASSATAIRRRCRTCRSSIRSTSRSARSPSRSSRGCAACARGRRRATRSRRARRVIGVPAVLAFLWINAIALRTIHLWFDVAWSPHALWSRRWCRRCCRCSGPSLALATMVVANRHGRAHAGSPARRCSPSSSPSCSSSSCRRSAASRASCRSSASACCCC